MYGWIRLERIGNSRILFQNDWQANVNKLDGELSHSNNSINCHVVQNWIVSINCSNDMEKVYLSKNKTHCVRQKWSFLDYILPPLTHSFRARLHRPLTDVPRPVGGEFNSLPHGYGYLRRTVHFTLGHTTNHRYRYTLTDWWVRNARHPPRSGFTFGFVHVIVSFPIQPAAVLFWIIMRVYRSWTNLHSQTINKRYAVKCIGKSKGLNDIKLVKLERRPSSCYLGILRLVKWSFK